MDTVTVMLTETQVDLLLALLHKYVEQADDTGAYYPYGVRAVIALEDALVKAQESFR